MRIEMARAISFLRLRPFDISTPEGRSNERYRRIALITASNFLARIVTLFVRLLTVPLALSYLGKQQYGLWAAITAVVTWIVLFDFGIVNGLVNGLSEANGQDNKIMATKLVSTAFFILIAVASVAGCVFVILAPIIPWDDVFGARGTVDADLVRWSVIAAVVPILFGFPLSIVRQIYAGYQKTYVANLFTVVGSVLTLLALIAAAKWDVKLPLYILVLGMVNVITLSMNFVFLVKFEMPWLLPRIKCVSRPAFDRLMTTSVPLFLFQIGSLLVNQSQFLILAHVSGLGTVAEYSIVNSLYVGLMSVIALTTASFLPPFRESVERGDRTWMTKGFRRMLVLRMGMAAIVALLILVAGNRILQIWLSSSELAFGFGVWMMLAVLILAATWSSAFSDLLRIMDVIWVQVGTVLINGIFVVLLTYILVPSMSVFGALLAAAFFSAVCLSWLMPVIARPILSFREATPGGQTR